MTQHNYEIHGDDLLWTAYRYSADELSETEAAKFELLLADDQGAREALAVAVGLAETVSAIERTAPITASKSPALVPASISQPAWTRSAGWVAIGAAACLALVFVWQDFQGAGFGPQDAPPGGVAQVEPTDDHSQLLAAMLDGAQGDESTEEASPFVAGIVGDDRQELLGPELEPMFDVSGLDSGLNDGDRDELDDPNTTPDWLMAAVVESKS